MTYVVYEGVTIMNGPFTVVAVLGRSVYVTAGPVSWVVAAYATRNQEIRARCLAAAPRDIGSAGLYPGESVATFTWSMIDRLRAAGIDIRC